MRIVLLGAPGAGKGTQADLISARKNILKISTGDMLRAEVAQNTPIGQSVRKIMAEGGLVPEELIIKLLLDELKKPKYQNGFLLDGFPRTLLQAEKLEAAGINIDHVIELAVPDDEIVNRVSGRRIHLASGRTYHMQYHPPKREGYDDITGEPLTQRADDTEETIRKRLKIYHEQTAPLIGWYQSHNYHYIYISGLGTVDEIYKEIENALKPKVQAR